VLGLDYLAQGEAWVDGLRIFEPSAAIPEPSALTALLGLGGAALALALRRRFR
jgi:MYXO-CTERM domain-containing protein